MSFSEAIVDVSAERVQGDGTITKAFFTSDFSAAKTAGAHDFDTFGAHTHRTANALFHSAAETDTAFELAGNVFSNERCVHFSLFDFCDVYVDSLSGEGFQRFFNIFNTSTATADDHARFCGMDNQFDTFCRAFDFNTGNTCDV